jgi:hypothetical protein
MADVRSTGGDDAATSSCSMFSVALAMLLGPQSIKFTHATFANMMRRCDVVSKSDE